MAYLPGPLLLQSAGNAGIATSEYDFAGDVAQQLGELDTVPAGWNSFLDDAGLLMSEPSDPFPGVDLDGAMQTLHAYSDPESFLGVGALVTGLGAADILLGTAISYAPAEAWQETSGAFVAPPPAETIGVPIIPPGSINFQVVGVTSSITTPPVSPSGLNTPSITFTNLSQYGSPNFRKGDQWQVTATGVAGQTVYVYAVFNGVDIGGGPQGDIGFDGKLILTGSMDEGQVGVWSEQWWIGSNQVATFNFVVVES